MSRPPTRVRLLVALFGLAMVVALLPASPASAAAPAVTFSAVVTDTNLVTLSWTVTGGDSSNLLYLYEDIGFKTQDCTPGAALGCSVAFRAKSGGVLRYTLSVKNDAGQYTNVTKEAVVAQPTRPTVPAARVHVDMLNPTAQTLSWTHVGPTDDRAHHFVEITPGGSFFPIGVSTATGLPTDAGKFPLNGSYAVPASALPLTGELSYSVAYCRQPDLTAVPICSAPAGVTWVVEPAQFAPSGRRFVPASQPVTLSWQGSGNLWFVAAPTLGVAGQWTTTPSLTIPAGQVVAGVHDATVTSCVSGGACSNRQDIKASKPGTIHQVLGWGQSTLFWPIVATLTPDDGSGPINLSTPVGGTYYPQAAEGAHVNANELVGYVITGNVGKVQLVVGGGASVPNLTTRTIAQDFTVQNIDTSTRGATGAGLDVTFDTSGGLWELGEFHTALAQVNGSTFTHLDAPAARVWNPTSGLFEKSKPFASSFGGAPTLTSGGGERVIDTGSAIYFTQGGANGSHNYSRLVRVSRTTADNPATPDDDRICAIHLPGDDQRVIGVAYDPATNRVWYGEAGKAGQPASVSWFVDGDLTCNNDLQYQLRQQQTNPNGTTSWVEVANDAAVDAAAAANRCDPGETTHCIRRIDLPAGAGTPGHVVVDAASGYLWIADWTGAVLSRLPLSGATTASVQSFPLPKPVIPGFFRGFPWQIRVDASAVYLNEYGDNQLLRFDKTVANPTTACATLTPAGSNPCIKEIFLPMGGNQVNAHSIALRNGKLWFTVAAESRGVDAGTTGSYFGYIDTASWAGAGAPTGVVYSGLATLGPPPRSDHWSVRGVEVSSAGKVALAEMGSAILVLTPR